LSLRLDALRTTSDKNESNILETVLDLVRIEGERKVMVIGIGHVSWSGFFFSSSSLFGSFTIPLFGWLGIGCYWTDDTCWVAIIKY
jgi:hypothetical protein